MWMSFLSAKPVLQEGLFWRIGNGNSVSIWNERWVPRPFTFKVLSPMIEHSAVWKVSALIDNSSCSWNQNLLRELLNNDDVELVSRVPISATNAPDKLVWRCTTNDKFFVKSAYHLFCEMELSAKWESSVKPIRNDIWPKIWKPVTNNAIKMMI